MPVELNIKSNWTEGMESNWNRWGIIKGGRNVKMKAWGPSGSQCWTGSKRGGKGGSKEFVCARVKEKQKGISSNVRFSLSFSLSLFSQAFFSLSFLEKLDLSWNQLMSLPADFSTSLSALRELRLEHNNLHHISGYRYLSVCWLSKCSGSPSLLHHHTPYSSQDLHVEESLCQWINFFS